MQQLHVYQAIWGMENLAIVDIDRELDRALDLILEAGFEGVGVGLTRKERYVPVARGTRERGLQWQASAFIHTSDELKQSIECAVEHGANHLNVQILARYDRVSDAVALLAEMEKVAAEAPFAVHYETHRGRLTNDLLFTLRVLEALPALKLTGDLSHYPVVHEFPLPVPQPDLDRISTILSRCWGFHGRISGSHQVQLPIEFAQHQGWVEQFQRWWKEGFRSWKERAPDDSVLTFMCELGPPNYAMTLPDGEELSDRWREALLIKKMVREIWENIG